MPYREGSSEAPGLGDEPGFRRRPSPPGPRSRLGPERARAALESAHAQQTVASRPPFAAECERSSAMKRSPGASERRSPTYGRTEAGERTPQESGRVSNRSLAQPRRGRNRLVQWAVEKAHFLSLPPPLTLRYLSTSTSFLTVAQAAHLRHPRK